MLNAREKRIWSTGHTTANYANRIKANIEQIADKYGEDHEVIELSDTAIFWLDQIESLSIALKQDVDYDSPGKMLLLHKLQREVNEMAEYVNISCRVISPGSNGVIANPVEQLKKRITEKHPNKGDRDE